MEALREIEELVAFEGRGAGTDAERRAAVHLQERLEEMGRDASIEPISVHPNWPVTHAIHAVAAIVGSVLAVDNPLVGTIVVLAVAVSAFGDLTGMFFLLRRLTGRRASQNVVSTEDGGKPGTLVLVAHYDAGRSGAVFGRRAVERRAVIGKLIRRPIGPFEPFFWSIVVILACSVVRLFDIDALALTIVQFIPTVVLIVSVPLLLDVALSGFVPAANDNASGVAAVLDLAERYSGDLENFDVWVLFTGAEEGLMLGMREWLRAHKDELDPTSTIFLNVDKVGHGTVRYVTKEGFVIAAAYHPALVELCREIDAEHYGARPVVSRSATDAHAARVRGFPAITISCLNALDYAPHYHQPTDTPERIDPDALERGSDFCSELVELIDGHIGPRL
jgi:hypothetical protein